MTTSSGKACSLCRETKPATEFRRKAKATDGLDSWCKPCARARNRSYYRANSDAVKARVKAWEQANPERYQENQRRAYLANAEKKVSAAKAWNAANPERARASAVAHTARRRAAKAGAVVTDVELAELWTGSCGICAAELNDRLAWPDPWSKSIDHIVPLSRGGEHAKANLQWTHLRCNVTKGNRVTNA